MQGHDVQRSRIRILGRCLSFCDLQFGRWRLGWLLFGGLLLLLLFLRRLLDLFHFIFVSHDTDSSLSPETKKMSWTDMFEHDPKRGSRSVRCATRYADFDASNGLSTGGHTRRQGD